MPRFSLQVLYIVDNVSVYIINGYCSLFTSCLFCLLFDKAFELTIISTTEVRLITIRFLKWRDSFESYSIILVKMIENSIQSFRFYLLLRLIDVTVGYNSRLINVSICYRSRLRATKVVFFSVNTLFVQTFLLGGIFDRIVNRRACS